MRKQKPANNKWLEQLDAAAIAHNSYFRKAPAPELITDEELRSEQRKLAKLAITPAEITLPPMQESFSERKKPGGLEELKAALHAFVIWLVGRIIQKRKGRMLTKSGMEAIDQLYALSALYRATTIAEGMDSVMLEAAFGEAYYHIMRESKHHYGSHSGRNPDMENYASHLEHFARSASNIY